MNQIPKSLVSLVLAGCVLLIAQLNSHAFSPEELPRLKLLIFSPPVPRTTNYMTSAKVEMTNGTAMAELLEALRKSAPTTNGIFFLWSEYEIQLVTETGAVVRAWRYHPVARVGTLLTIIYPPNYDAGLAMRFGLWDTNQYLDAKGFTVWLRRWKIHPDFPGGAPGF